MNKTKINWIRDHPYMTSLKFVNGVQTLVTQCIKAFVKQTIIVKCEEGVRKSSNLRDVIIG